MIEPRDDTTAVTDAAVTAGNQGLLFNDDVAPLPENTGFRGPIACSAAGITYRQLDYWARTGLVDPTVRSATGSGTQRLYSFKDILLLKIIKRLLDAGVRPLGEPHDGAGVVADVRDQVPAAPTGQQRWRIELVVAQLVQLAGEVRGAASGQQQAGLDLWVCGFVCACDHGRLLDRDGPIGLRAETLDRGF